MKKAALYVIFIIILSIGIISCKNGTVSENDIVPTNSDMPSPTVPVVTESVPEIKWDGAYLGKEDFLAILSNDLDDVYNGISEYLGELKDTVNQIAEEGQKKIKSAVSVNEAKKAYSETLNSIFTVIPKAEGSYSFISCPTDERTGILSLLEQYAVKEGLAGLTLYEEASYVMINPRINAGSPNYIKGYGFGILQEGTVSQELDHETDENWKRYFHTYVPEDPVSLNVLKDYSEETAGLYDLMAAGLYTTFMNESKTGYDWVPELAKEKPQPVNDGDSDGKCDTWRAEVKTGDDGLKYKSGSDLANRKAFDGRAVNLEDYEYAFQIANDSKINEGLFLDNGIRTYKENGRNYIEVSFTKEMDQYEAMYHIASSIYMPIPKDFIKLVGTDAYLSSGKDGNETIVDNCLSLGGYFPEKYVTGEYLVFSKNPYYVLNDSKYEVPGVHIKIYPEAKYDYTAGVNGFLKGYFDYCEVPKDYVDDFKEDERLHEIPGNDVFRLSINTCGSKDSDNKTVFSNEHFRRAVSFSLDRLKFSDSRSVLPSVSFLGSCYISDPERGISYSDTIEHCGSVKHLLKDTDGYGFSLELARKYFKMALTELEAEGTYTPGTKEDPCTIELAAAWMYPEDELNFHNEIKQYLETAFNDPMVSGGLYKLDIRFTCGDDWKAVYDNLDTGDFDLCYAPIRYNGNDPFKSFGVISPNLSVSDGFTINYGKDTNTISGYPIVYDGKLWSFDALYKALTGTALKVSGGILEDLYDIKFFGIVYDEENDKYTGSFNIHPKYQENTDFTTDKIICRNLGRYYYQDGESVFGNVDFSCDKSKAEEITVTFVIDSEIADEFYYSQVINREKAGYVGISLYYSCSFDGFSESYCRTYEDMLPVC